MSRRASAVLVAACLAALATPAFAAPPPARASRPALSPDGRMAPSVYDVSGLFDANEIRSSVTNFGILARDPGGGPGFEWPQGSGQKVVYSAGLWLAAYIFGSPRAAIADFGSEFLPGQTTFDGEPADPGAQIKVYRVWKITQDDLVTPSLDYLNWPSAQGAPLDTADKPLLLGDQTLFTVFNDAANGNHTQINGSTLPLQVEVTQTLWGYNRPYEMSRVMLVKYHVHNRSRFRWPEFYVGLWADPDIGDPNDDLSGCDSSLNLGYVYDSFSEFKHEALPAVGVMVLADSIIGIASPGLSAFAGFPLSEDPGSYWETLAYLRGTQRDETPWLCPGVTRFPFSGDPAAGTGCLDSDPGDRRIVVSAGPFDMISNSSLDVIVAYLVGFDPAARTPADNVTALRRLARRVRDSWRADFADIPPLPAKVTIHSAFPNPTTGAASVDVEVPGGASLQGFDVLDVKGRRVWTAPRLETRSGFARLSWDGRTVGGVPAPPGVYLFRVISDSGLLYARTVLLR